MNSSDDRNSALAAEIERVGLEWHKGGILGQAHVDLIVAALRSIPSAERRSMNCATRCYAVAEEERCVDCPSRLPQAAPVSASEDRERDLNDALVHVAHGMHKEPQFMLMRGVSLLGNNEVRVYLPDGRVVHATERTS